MAAKSDRPAIELPKYRDPATLEELAHRLSRELQDALDNRTRIVGEEGAIDQWHQLYEGGQKIAKSWPWKDAANLTSYIGTEKVNAWRARVMQTIFTEPVWIVEGWGDAAAKASFVETFHQWKLEEERLQSTLGKVFHNAFVEGTGVLEVAERPTPRVITRDAYFAPLQLPDGTQAMDPVQGTPVLQRDPNNQPVEVPASMPGAIKQTVTEVVNVAAGPQYRVLSLKDYLALPGHVSDIKDLWGHAKRFWPRLSTLQQREKAGYYVNVDRVSMAGAVTPRAEHARMGQDVPTELEPRETRELWEVVFLDDLEDLGTENWYVATVSILDRVILRLQRLSVGAPTFLLFTPIPRPYSVYGYSLIGHQLGSVIDEHTSIRNQITDRSTMVNAAPIKRVQGALWDPQETPWGPLAVIDVRSADEVQPMVIPDVPGSMVQREAAVLNAAERVSGLNDVASGVNPAQDRTLGENQMVTTSSFVRIEEAVKYLQEPMEQLFTLRHEIWKRVLQRGPAKLPPSVIAILEGRGQQVPNDEVDASMLDGVFRGKPRASVEGADPNRRRNDFVGFTGALTNFARVVPALAQHLNTPQFLQAFLREAMRVFAWKEPRALMGLEQDQQPGFSPTVTNLPPIGLPGAAPAAGPPPPPPVQ